MKEKKLFVSDLDDTLVDEKKLPSKKLLSELNLILNNVSFCIATARSYDSIYSRFKSIKNKFKVICRCGSLVYDEFGNIIHYELLKYDFLKIINFAVENDMCPVFVTIENGIEKYYYHKNYSNDELLKSTNKMNLINVSKQSLSNLQNVISIYCFGKIINNIGLKNINIRTYSNFIHFSSMKATKGNACLWLKNKYYFDSIISFGNDCNDYDMLDISNIGYLIYKKSRDKISKYNNIKFDDGKTILQIMRNEIKLKVLMIPSGYYPECCGGVEVITQSLSEGLLKKDIDVVVMCQSNITGDEYINGIHVYRIKPKDIPNPNNNHFKYKINRMLQMYNPFNKKIMKKIIQFEKPDIIHLHMARTLSMSVLTVANKLHIPVVSTLHEYFSLWNFDPFGRMDQILTSKPQWYVNLIRNKHKKLTKKVKYVTAPLKKTIEEYQKEKYYEGVPNEEILNALPMNSKLKRRIILDEKKGRIKNSKVTTFLLISRLMPFKGIELTLDAFMKVKNNNIVLNIVGDGELSNYVKKCSVKDSRIKYHGYLIGKKKDEIFRNSDILIFPTTELETYGLVILEAYNNSMPIITSNVEATRRLVKNNITGKIIDNISVDKLSKAIMEYTNKQELLKKMNNCFEYIDKNEYEIFINKYIQVYKKVLEENNESK